MDASKIESCNEHLELVDAAWANTEIPFNKSNGTPKNTMPNIAVRHQVFTQSSKVFLLIREIEKIPKPNNGYKYPKLLNTPNAWLIPK